MKKLRFVALLTSVCLSVTVIVNASGNFTSANGFIMHPMWKMKSMSATASPEGYSPAQIKKVYGIGSGIGTGKGKTIAIVTAYGSDNLENDLDVFDRTFNLPSADVSIHDCGVMYRNSSWALETSLDAEWAHVMAPDAKLIIVEARSDNSDDLLDAVNYATSESDAQIISMSWGGDEYDTQEADDSNFSKNGVVFLASAGDDGTGSIWPSSSSKVISVGGTSLELNDSGNRDSEAAWEDSGGGTSQYETSPSWQNTFGINSSTRESPDVSFDADPSTGVSVYCSVPVKGSTGWYQVGGTSLGAPAWAGIIACLNQNSTYIKDAGSFYSLAGGTKYTNAHNCFYDITSGSNGIDATPGYDEVTGLGSPDVNNLSQSNSQGSSSTSSSSQGSSSSTSSGSQGSSKTSIIGVSYLVHVQNFGWQAAVKNGALAGTTGKGLRVEALKIKLFGDLPKTASISYQANVQKLGWQKAVSNGALAGTTGKNLKIGAVRITIKGMPGYQVKYRVYVQKKGWMTWKTTKSGTTIASAPIAGTIGQSLRVEAIQISVQKTTQ